MRYVVVLAVLVLSACRQSVPDPGPTTAGAASEASPVSSAAPGLPEHAITSAGELRGEYRVAGVDGEAIDLPYGLALSIGEDSMTLTEGCRRRTWGYRFDAGRLMTERHGPVGRCEGPPHPTEQAIGLALDAATDVRRTAANGIEFLGGGHTVTVFSQ